MRMRYKNNIGAFAGIGKKGSGQSRSIWNERGMMLNEYLRLAKQVARYGVIFTSQNMKDFQIYDLLLFVEKHRK